MTCAHRRTQRRKKTFGPGLFHVVVRCLDCGENSLGPGKWAPHLPGDANLQEDVRENPSQGVLL